MQYNTKYNIGETLYAFDNAEYSIRKFVVGRISVNQEKECTSIKYYPAEDTIWTSYDEGHCFKTRKELLEYIDRKITF